MLVTLTETGEVQAGDEASVEGRRWTGSQLQGGPGRIGIATPGQETLSVLATSLWEDLIFALTPKDNAHTFSSTVVGYLDLPVFT